MKLSVPLKRFSLGNSLNLLRGEENNQIKKILIKSRLVNTAQVFFIDFGGTLFPIVVLRFGVPSTSSIF